MRLIDADAIVFTHAIARSIDDGHNWNELCVTKDEIDDMPTAEPERKWIPVSEKLPKVRTDVLLAFEKNMAVGFYSHDCWNVNTGNGFYTGVFTDEDKPIAWMPLPEPWRGE